MLINHKSGLVTSQLKADHSLGVSSNWARMILILDITVSCQPIAPTYLKNYMQEIWLIVFPG